MLLHSSKFIFSPNESIFNSTNTRRLVFQVILVSLAQIIYYFIQKDKKNIISLFSLKKTQQFCLNNLENLGIFFLHAIFFFSP